MSEGGCAVADSEISAVLFDDGRPEGSFSTQEANLPRIGAAIRAAQVQGEVRSATETSPGIYRFGEPCRVEKPRPCILETVLVRMDELAREDGQTAPEVERIAETGVFSEEEARDAVLATIGRLNGAPRAEAELWYRKSFEEGAAAHV